MPQDLAAAEAHLAPEVARAIEAGRVIEREVQRRTESSGAMKSSAKARDEYAALVEERAAAWEEYTKTATGGTPDLERMRAITDRDAVIYARQQALQVEMGAGSDARRAALRDVLSEVREMGPGREGLELGDGKSGRAAKAMHAVSDLLPRSWFDEMNGWVRGSMDDPRARLMHLLGRSNKPMKPGLRVRVAGRGHFSAQAREIVISEKPSAGSLPKGASTALHEMVHWAEHSVPAIRRLEWAFYRSRTMTADGYEATVRLRDRFPGSRYDANEIARDDKWSNLYMGKDYGNGLDSSYEVMTMGVERAFATDPLWMTDIDAEHLWFVIGMLALA